MPPEEFESYINDAINCNFSKLNFDRGKDDLLHRTFFKDKECRVQNGYAPFCKLFIIENFTDARVGSLPITLETFPYLRSGYHSRKADELPVLSRWLDLPLGKPLAKWLIVVLYSGEQINREIELDYEKALKEYEKLDESNHTSYPVKAEEFTADWGIITILGQSHPDEEPMPPATIIRNAYMHGGSGAPFDEEYYKRSVEFWEEHALLK